MFKRSRSFWFGFTLPYHAGRLVLSSKTLLIWSVVPVVLTMVLYFYVIGALQDEAQLLLKSLFSDWGLDPQGWIYFILDWTTWLLLLLISALTFTFASSLVASPFNDTLAEKAERFGKPALSPVGRQRLAHHVRTVAIDLAKTIAATCAGIAAFIFSLVPFLNLITFALAFLLVTFQYVSYPQTRREVALKDSARFLWRHFYACVGLGAAITLLYTIPVVASLALPIAVVSGTLLAARAPGDSELPALK